VISIVRDVECYIYEMIVCLLPTWFDGFESIIGFALINGEFIVDGRSFFWWNLHTSVNSK
jgi:hypothetical protein